MTVFTFFTPGDFVSGIQFGWTLPFGTGVSKGGNVTAIDRMPSMKSTRLYKKKVLSQKTVR
jgi:hypothetical protein